MGKRWTTPDQQAFLEQHVQQFLEARRKSTVSWFFGYIWTEWCKRWSERDAFLTRLGVQSESTGAQRALTESEEAELAQVELKKQRAVQKWFYWVTRDSSQRACAKAVKKWMQGVITDSGRALQVLEVYQKKFAEKITHAVDARVSADARKDKALHLKIRREVVAELWEEEDPEVQLQIEEETAAMKDAMKDAKKKKRGKPLDLPTPQEYDEAIKAAPSVLSLVFDALAEATGWVFFVTGAGPNPSDDGFIYMEHYYFGEKHKGLDFAAGYDGFKEFYQKPFAKHARNCFSPDVRRSRALPNEAGQRLPAVMTGIDDVIINQLELVPSNAQSGEPSGVPGSSRLAAGDRRDGAEFSGPGDARFAEHFARSTMIQTTRADSGLPSSLPPTQSPPPVMTSLPLPPAAPGAFLPDHAAPPAPAQPMPAATSSSPADASAGSSSLLNSTQLLPETPVSRVDADEGNRPLFPAGSLFLQLGSLPSLPPAADAASTPAVTPSIPDQLPSPTAQAPIAADQAGSSPDDYQLPGAYVPEPLVIEPRPPTTKPLGKKKSGTGAKKKAAPAAKKNIGQARKTPAASGGDGGNVEEAGDGSATIDEPLPKKRRSKPTVNLNGEEFSTQSILGKRPRRR